LRLRVTAVLRCHVKRNRRASSLS